MVKYAVYVALGDYYRNNLTGYSRLKFTIQNVVDFSVHLQSSWENIVPLVDKTASKNVIIETLNEAISKCKNDDDWLLFYYAGHASRLMVNDPNGGGQFVTYCVSYSEKLTANFFPGLNEFFTEIDYDQVIKTFHQEVPNGHIITVLDCCNAFGLVENFGTQTDYHTVIAACSDGASAYYNSNSSFFKAFKQCWDMPFQNMSSRLRSLMVNMRSPNIAKVQVATKFLSFTL